MEYDARIQSMRGNNTPFSHATAFHEMIPATTSSFYMARALRRATGARLGGNSPVLRARGGRSTGKCSMYDMGFHDTPEKKIGALFWRMHRCARIIFSLKFHMGEWSPQECVDFLVDRVGFERENAMGEVRRSFQGGYGPLYQAAYLLGGLQMRALRRELVDSGQMGQKAFHDEMLRQGSHADRPAAPGPRPPAADARHLCGLEVPMTTLPTSERLLLGPGPSMISPRVMRALAAPVLGHLDPDLMAMMDETRGQLRALFRAPEGSFVFAVSGTGTSGLEAAVANLVQDGTRVLAVVTGYFGDRLASVCERYGGRVTRLDAEWGRACNPQRVRDALSREGADIVCVVHAETSTGVRNPVQEISAAAHDAGALAVVDAVTSLGGHPLEMEGWGIDAAYSCTQKCVGAPSGLAPVAFAPSALARRVKCRSFYLDLGLLEDYWVRRSPTTRSRHLWSTPSTRRCWRSERRGSSGAGRGTSVIIASWPPASPRWGSACCRPRASGSGR